MRRPTLAAMAAGICLAALVPAHAAAAVCDDAWRSLPALSPDPAYESPNDPDLLYRNSVVRGRSPYSIWANQLARSMQTFIQVRGLLATWTNTLDAAERNFWRDFDADGKVSQASVNELAYWLHKREVWGVARGALMSSGNDALKVLFGDGQLAFLRPGEFPPAATPGLSTDTGKSFASPAYRGYITQLEQLSFLRLSACAPVRNGTASGRVLQDILYPYYDVSDASDVWKSVQAWAAGGQGRMDQLDKILTGLTRQQKLDTGALKIIGDIMNGKTASATEVQYARYSQLIERTQVMGFVLYGQQLSANGFSVPYTDQNAMPTRKSVVINGATLDQVQTCVKDNWEMIRRYCFDQTCEVGMNYALNPTMAAIQYKKHLGYAALYACGSLGGLNDPRVAEMIAPYANRRPAQTRADTNVPARTRQPIQ